VNRNKFDDVHFSADSKNTSLCKNVLINQHR